MTEKDIAFRIADEIAASGIDLIASLPDNWIAELIETVNSDTRFTHVPVNREESAIGLCAGVPADSRDRSNAETCGRWAGGMK